MRHPITLALIGGLSGLVTACASTDGSSTRDQTIAALLDDVRVGEKVDRISFTRGINGFSDETRHSVVLRRTVNDEYLVITNFCPDLDRAQSLRLDSRSGVLTRQDFIRVYLSAFGPSSTADQFTFNRCQIDAIYKWNPDAAEPDDVSDETDGSDA